MRTQTLAKRQLVTNAIENKEEMEKLNFENELILNTKACQASLVVTPILVNVAVQTDLSIQMTATNLKETNHYEDDLSSLSDVEELNELNDKSFCSDGLDSQSDADEEDIVHQNENTKPKGTAFIVYWSCLSLLLNRCLICPSIASIKKAVIKGSALCINLFCFNGHHTVWRSQPMAKWYYLGNLKLSASVLFSSNTFRKISKYFKVMDIPWVSESRYYRIQNYMFGVTQEAWKEEVTKLDQLSKGPLILSADGRCDSPGHNAKYLTYSFHDPNLQKVIAISLTQVTEVDGISNNMEKQGMIKVLDEMKERKKKISQVTTDRHGQIKKYLREKRSDISHQFDIWHFCKSILKKLLKASKKKSCASLAPWIKSICNHFWWACATCGGDENVLKEKWTSIIFHIQNKHLWTGNTVYHKCCHPDLSTEEERSKAWLSPKSDAFQALQKIVFDKRMLNDMRHLTKFSHTGVLEVYHSVLNKWAPKSSHFSFKGMSARCKLAAIDFNQNSNLKQAKTKCGDDRYNLVYSKITKTWVAKPIKEKKTLDIFKALADKAVKAIIEKKEFVKYDNPDIPKNIAPTPKPDKMETVSKQRSRFNVD